MTKSRTSRATRANVRGGKFSDELFIKFALLVVPLLVLLVRLLLRAVEVLPVAPLRRLPPRIIGPDDESERDAGSNDEGLADEEDIIPVGRDVVDDPSMLMLEDERKLLLAEAKADGDVVDDVVGEAATSTDGEDEDVGDCCCCCDMIDSMITNIDSGGGGRV